MGKMIEYTRPDGQKVNGWLEEPTNAAHAPALVVIQEWWGLNDQIKGVAKVYADAGFRVVVPDLYRGAVTLEAKEAEHLMTGLNFGDAASQDVRGAVQYLKATGSAKVGVTGYCMGGAVTLLSACFAPEVDAAVSWYGFPPLEYLNTESLRAPIMGHFATQDPFFAFSQVSALEDKLKSAGVPVTFHAYDCLHAFANETQVDPVREPSNRYDPKAAALALERTLAFFKQHLA